MSEKPGSAVESILEEAIEHAETVWADLASSEIAEAIPVVRNFVKIWRAVDDFRASILAAKLRAFVLEPNLQTEAAKEKLRAQAATEDGQKIGQTLFLVLERLTDLQKPIWLAKLLVGNLNGEVSGSDLRRLAAAIDAAFGDDLIQLIVATGPALQTDNYAPWKRNLVQSGLTEMSPKGPIGGGFVFPVSALGETFRRTIRKYSP